MDKGFAGSIARKPANTGSVYREFLHQKQGDPATRARRLRALNRSSRLLPRWVPFSVGAIIRGPKLEHTLAERILSEQQVFALL
jgi:hypothetical protein